MNRQRDRLIIQAEGGPYHGCGLDLAYDPKRCSTAVIRVGEWVGRYVQRGGKLRWEDQEQVQAPTATVGG